ncbi:MAG: transcriptional repressor [Planctomycetes bacterium]|nr:transcriptional repressor [Planctomycetota bacterium]
MTRMTRQRRAILTAFEATQRPLSPVEVADAVRDAGDTGINLATVYRNIRSMVDAGQLTAVRVLGQPARYEPAGLGHHHHFHCDGCDRVFDLPPCPSTLLRGLAPPGFAVSGHELQLTGQCPECR